MIESKDDYRFYLDADRVALGIRRKRPLLFQDEVWRFQRLLRKAEFLGNCNNDFLSQIAYLQTRYSLQKLSVKLGFSIPRNAFGPGLSISHRGTIVVLPEVKVGENCRINQGVTIGGGSTKAPLIGNNVFIGPGAVIWGDIEIADGIAIGANSYVATSFKDPNITIAGCPAKKVSDRGSEHLWLRATEILRHVIE
jgi:serine O-acetyltransferase